MLGEYAAQVEFRHSVQARDREQHVLELISDHFAPPPGRPDRLRSRAAMLRASARRAWPRPIAVGRPRMSLGTEGEICPAIA